MTITRISASGVERGPWCTKCGYVAAVVRQSLDPRRPIGRCRRGEPSGRGCGEVVASYDLAEAEFAYRARRRKLTEARHAHHPTDHPERWATWCRACANIQQELAHTR